MLNNTPTLKKIFIYRMLASAIIQFFVLGLLLILVKDYLDYNQKINLINDLIINDSFTQEELSRYKILNNNYALNLALHNLANERKLDSIWFSTNFNSQKQFKKCISIDKTGYKLCHDRKGTFYGVTSLKVAKKFLGYIITSKKYSIITSAPIYYSLILILISVIGAFGINFIILFLSLKKKIEGNTKRLLTFIALKDCTEKNIQNLNIRDYAKIANKFLNERKQIEKLEKEAAFRDAKKCLAEQVAHDIRSPLAALNAALRDIQEISEDRKIIIKNATGRINDIANNLLFQYKKENYSEFPKEELRTELLFVIIENIISEKKFEYSNKNVEISSIITEESYSCFANIHLSIFKRILSNLINNGVEAIKENGFVNVNLNSDEEYIYIIIEDNGCGISTKNLLKVTEKGFSLGKRNGAGVGLYYAKEQIKKMYGNLMIESKIHVGTKIKITLPKIPPPKWFCQELNLSPNSQVLILDDDISIHQIWTEKISHYMPDVKLSHAFNPSNLFKLLNSKNNYDVCLIDFDLREHKKSGLKYIEEFNLTNNAILVTSAFENIDIRNRCEQLGVTIIPKVYIPFIRIKTFPAIQQNNNTIVFIDDDPTMRMVWSLAAAEANKVIHTFASPEEFNKKIGDFDKNSVIYIDSELHGQLRGEEYAKILHKKGFNSLYLATGYPKETFSNMPWIKSIVGKMPPFHF